MRLIDADTLPEMETERCDTTDAFEIKAKVAGRNHMRKIINDAPTIDAVQVVRCGECRRAIPFSVAGNRDAFCHCDLFDATMTRKDFCSYGERKDGIK